LNATATIGRFTLKLSPLKRSDLPGARYARRTLAMVQLIPVASKPWFAAYGDAVGFIFLAARGNHRGLRLDELDDEAEPSEIHEAFKALDAIMSAQWGRLWDAPYGSVVGDYGYEKEGVNACPKSPPLGG
jgi:hypothetical protein